MYTLVSSGPVAKRSVAASGATSQCVHPSMMGEPGRQILGVLRLDYSYPPALGDVACPTTFSYPTLQRVVDGLTFPMCQHGTLEGDTRQALLAAIRWLEQQGVAMIIGDCGFMLNYQELARRASHLPVFLSSLLLLPTLLTTSSPSKTVAVFTANSTSLLAMKAMVHRLCGLEEEEGNRRIIMVGCQEVPGFEAVALGSAVDQALVEKGVVKLAKETQQEHPHLCAFLFECTELPGFSSAVRRATGLPVWDAITGADHLMAGRDTVGFQPNRKPGRRATRH